MPATCLFKMKNAKKTCTAASYLWCQMLLTGKEPTEQNFHQNDPTLRDFMYRVGISELDSDVLQQAQLLNLEVVATDTGNFTSLHLAEVFKAHAPHLGIFWNEFHTMAYRYSHLDKQYFDNNGGLWRANKTSQLVAKMNEVKAVDYSGKPWTGYAVLKSGSMVANFAPVVGEITKAFN